MELTYEQTTKPSCLFLCGPHERPEKPAAHEVYSQVNIFMNG